MTEGVFLLVVMCAGSFLAALPIAYAGGAILASPRSPFGWSPEREARRHAGERHAPIQVMGPGSDLDRLIATAIANADARRNRRPLLDRIERRALDRIIRLTS